MKTINFKYISRVGFYSIVIFFVSLFSLNSSYGQAHQGKLYIDDDCAATTCLDNVVAIETMLSQLKSQCNITVNVLLLTQDCAPEKNGDKYIGPNVDGNSIWKDASVDYLIVILPGNNIVHGNSPYSPTSNNNDYEAVSSAISNIDILNYPTYASKMQCLIETGLDKIAQIHCEGNYTIPFTGSCNSINLDVTNHFIIQHKSGDLVSLVDPSSWIDQNSAIVQRIKSNYCTNIAVYEQYPILQNTNINYDQFHLTEIYNNVKISIDAQDPSNLDKNLLLFLLLPADAEGCKYQFLIHFPPPTNPTSNLCYPQYYNMGPINRGAIQTNVFLESGELDGSKLKDGITAGLNKLEKILLSVENLTGYTPEINEDIPEATSCNYVPSPNALTTLDNSDFYPVNSCYYTSTQSSSTPISSLENLKDSEGLYPPGFYKGYLGSTAINSQDTILYDYAGLSNDEKDRIIGSNNFVAVEDYFNKKAVSIVTSDENLSYNNGIPPQYLNAKAKFDNFDMDSPNSPLVLHHIHYNNANNTVTVEVRYKGDFMSVTVPDFPQVDEEDRSFVAQQRNLLVKNTAGFNDLQLNISAGGAAFENCGSGNDVEFKKFGYKGDHFWLTKMNTGLATVRETLKNVAIPPVTYAQVETNPAFKENFIISIPPIVAGGGDYIIDELKSIPDLVVFASSFALDAQIRTQTYQALSDPAKIFQGMVDDLTLNGQGTTLDVKKHKFGKSACEMTIGLYTGGVLVKNALKTIREKGAKGIAKDLQSTLVNVTDQFKAKIKGLGDGLSAIQAKALKKEFWDFANTLPNQTKNLDKFIKNLYMVDLWKKMKGSPDLNLASIMDKFPIATGAFYNNTISKAFIDLSDAATATAAKIAQVKTFLKDIEVGDLNNYCNKIWETPKLVGSWDFLDAFESVRRNAVNLGIMDRFKSKWPSKQKSEVVGEVNQQGFLGYCLSDLGCFVENTSVLMANYTDNKDTLNTALPIQNIEIDDIVKSYAHEDNNYYAIANLDTDLDLGLLKGWQSYDYQHITPDMWQIGEFIIHGKDGKTVEVEINRPIEWFTNSELYKRGDITFLEISELGIEGLAILQSIRPTKIDTRILEINETGIVNRPVIGKFKRYVESIVDYTFSNGDIISSTPNHSFYSKDRLSFIPIGEIEVGETILTASKKELKFISSKLREKGEYVFNFEVWRTHNYFISGNYEEEWLLVHNACWKTVDEVKGMSKAKRDAFLDDAFDQGIEWTPSNQKSYFGRGSFMESLLRDTKYKDIKATGKNRDGGSDAMHIGNDQYPTIDFVDGAKGISVKTTKKTNPYAWVESGLEGNKYIKKNINRLLEGIRDGEFGNAVSGINKADLDIYIKDFHPDYPKVHWEIAVNKHIDKLGADLKAVRNSLNINVHKINDVVNTN